MSAPTKTRQPVVVGAEARNRRKGPSRSSTVAELAGAAVVALGIGLLANGALGMSSAIGVVVVSYLAFVAVVAVVELNGAGHRPAAEIDLTAAEPEATTAHGAATAPEIATATEAERPWLRTVPGAGELPDEPIRQRHVTAADVVEAGVAAVGAAAFAELVRVVVHMRSTVGFVIWWYAAFVALSYLLARDHDDAEVALDRVVTMLVWSVGVALIAVLAWMVTTVFTEGWAKAGWSFLTQDMRTTGPLTPGGGVKHAIIGTAEQVGLATIVVIPLGILTAVYLHEIRGRLARPIRFIVDAMSGLPSIVAGLLVYTIWVQDHGYSGVAAAAALVILMLPTMTRATEEILRTVPDSLREGAFALGAPQWRLVQRVVLPTALAGVITATLLAIARAIGETAPMLMTAFGSDAVNNNPARGPQSDLPLFVWKLIRLPNETSQQRAWAGMLVLVMFVLVLFVTARLVARRGLRRLGGTR